jgi:hypothetical protein
MAAFSGRGPVQNGRTKPDVVAPGTAILSTRSRATQAMQTIGWLASPDPLYFNDGGTSMPTPLVAGCAAVVRQFLTTAGGIATPSAALVKAMLINGATPIKDQYTPPEVGAIPDISEGFGRVDIPATVGLSPPTRCFDLRMRRRNSTPMRRNRSQFRLRELTLSSRLPWSGPIPREKRCRTIWIWSYKARPARNATVT